MRAPTSGSLTGSLFFFDAPFFAGAAGNTASSFGAANAGCVPSMPVSTIAHVRSSHFTLKSKRAASALVDDTDSLIAGWARRFKLIDHSKGGSPFGGADARTRELKRLRFQRRELFELTLFVPDAGPEIAIIAKSRALHGLGGIGIKRTALQIVRELLDIVSGVPESGRVVVDLYGGGLRSLLLARAMTPTICRIHFTSSLSFDARCAGGSSFSFGFFFLPALGFLVLRSHHGVSGNTAATSSSSVRDTATEDWLTASVHTGRVITCSVPPSASAPRCLRGVQPRAVAMQFEPALKLPGEDSGVVRPMGRQEEIDLDDCGRCSIARRRPATPPAGSGNPG